MTFIRVTRLIAILLSGASSVVQAADRPESIATINMSVQSECPVTPGEAFDDDSYERTAELAPVIGMILAGIAGDLVKSGVSAVASALESASQEKAVVAEATTGGYLMEVRADGRSGGAITKPKRCLVLFSGGETTDVAAFLQNSDFVNRMIPASKTDVTSVKDKFLALGINSPPSLYVEALLFPVEGGTVIRPALVWYRQALKGAPAKVAASELHVSLATPGYGNTAGPTGNIFAAARIPLPKIAPGQLLLSEDLLRVRPIILPARATDDSADLVAQKMAARYAAIATASANVKAGRRALDAAKRLQVNKPGPEADEAVITAKDALGDFETVLEQAQLAAPDNSKALIAGPTNFQMRFAVIKDANAFGLALAKALKAQEAAVGKAVTDTLSPKPAWTGDDTAYLAAMTAVSAKQREYDAAVTKQDIAAIPGLGDELLGLKAKANEAAVASKRTIPYPKLL